MKFIGAFSLAFAVSTASAAPVVIRDHDHLALDASCVSRLERDRSAAPERARGDERSFV